VTDVDVGGRIGVRVALHAAEERLVAEPADRPAGERDAGVAAVGVQGVGAQAGDGRPLDDDAGVAALDVQERVDVVERAAADQQRPAGADEEQVAPDRLAGAGRGRRDVALSTRNPAAST
jgi:hypothetical protein